ncbi:MAG: hypothetical protein NTY53_06030 [Kiritimatiellaeota bacterium]|nr:hypothetical protein [Kiritimatiellota bacterium]
MTSRSVLRWPPLPFTQDGEKISVTRPGKGPDAPATVLCLETK